MLSTYGIVGLQIFWSRFQSNRIRAQIVITFIGISQYITYQAYTRYTCLLHMQSNQKFYNFANTFFILPVNTLDIMASRFIKEICLQLLIYLLSFSFFSINVIKAWHYDVDSHST